MYVSRGRAKSWCAICLHDLVEGKACVADGVGSGVCSEGGQIGISALEDRREGMLLAGGNMDTSVHLHNFDRRLRITSGEYTTWDRFCRA